MLRTQRAFDSRVRRGVLTLVLGSALAAGCARSKPAVNSSAATSVAPLAAPITTSDEGVGSSKPEPHAPPVLAAAPKCAKASASSGCADTSVAPLAQGRVSAAPPIPTRSTKPVQSGLSRGTLDPVDAELEAADRAYQTDDLASAKAHYEQARRLAPKDPAPQIGLVRVLLADSDVATDFAAAPKNGTILALLRKVDAALKLDESYAPGYVERGRLLLILGSAPEALNALDRAQRLAPEDAETQSALGVALLATGKPAEALARLRRASDLDPENPERLTNLGTAFLIQGEVTEAVRVFSRASQMAPDDARLHGDLGAAYLALNQPAQALPELDRAVALAPERATFVSNLSYAYFLTGQLADAEKTASRASVLDPKLGSAWINLGAALAKKGDLVAAGRAYERALALDPSDPRAKANLAELEDMKRAKASSAPAANKH